jgi:hypothetical protein
LLAVFRINFSARGSNDCHKSMILSAVAMPHLLEKLLIVSRQLSMVKVEFCASSSEKNAVEWRPFFVMVKFRTIPERWTEVESSSLSRESDDPLPLSR